MSSIATMRAGVPRGLRRTLVATMATLLAGVGVLAQPAAAAFEGSFENPVVSGNLTTYYAPTTFGQWTVTAGDINHGQGPGGTPCQGGAGQCVDLNGNGPGAIAQVFDTPEGSPCQVSFAMSHNKYTSQARLVASIDNVAQGTFLHNTPVLWNDGKWEPRSFSFTAGGPTTTLAFRTLETGNAGPQIDNVVVECRPTGLLKVCKVAGPLVTVGQGFNFTANGGPQFSVPAGPGPAGYCTKVGRFPLGSNVTVVESAVTGTWVGSIGVVPANRLVGTPNLAGRSVTANIGAGVTEVTFTNETVKSGYIEICKEYRTDQMPKPAPLFHFDVPGVPGGVDVPAGACSPALRVPAGTITVAERLSSGSALTQCSTIPSNNLVSCTLATGKADVKVVAGGPSTQTIVTFVNVPRQT